MIDEQDLCRNEINKRIGRVKRFFRWVVSEELIPSSVIHGLDSVKGLRRGRSRARESAKVKPVLDEHVEAILPFLPPQLAAMIKVQRLTGMRPGEVVLLRGCDIDKTTQPDVWIYFPDKHKKDWLGQPRAITLGPQAQEVLKPFLDRPSDAYFFSPLEAYRWRLENRSLNSNLTRKTPVYPSELRAREKMKQLRRRRKPKRPKGTHYTVSSYWKALEYAFKTAEKSGVEVVRWFPYQLRHSRGTALRKRFGIEASRVTLGHSRLDATEIYAEKDLMLAVKVAREAG
jgi:integrase